MSRIILAQRLNYTVCNTACNLFLNNSEFRVEQILRPQTLPHSPPIFLWVTCGAAGKPLLFLSLHGRPGSTSVHVSGGKAFHLWWESWLNFFQEVWKTANAYLFSSYVVCCRHTPIPLSIHAATACPASWFVCCCFQILHLPWWHLDHMMVEGFSCSLG